LECSQPRRWWVGTALLNQLVLPAGIIAALGLVVSLFGAAYAGEVPESRVQMTDHYRITLDIGPVQPVWLAEQASEAKEGHIVLNPHSIPMDPQDLVPMSDQGQAVNRLLEVFVYDRETGALLSDLRPRVAITDQETDWRRDLPSLAKMYGVNDGPSMPCFGTNAYLNGIYRFVVTVGGETATFEDITVAESSAEPSSPPSASGEVSAKPEN
jgi:hypothetical protein